MAFSLTTGPTRLPRRGRAALGLLLTTLLGCLTPALGQERTALRASAGGIQSPAVVRNAIPHPAAVLTKDDILTIRDGRFFLDGKPFAEISFNKFDLFWQLYDQLTAGQALDDANPKVQAQDRALRNLHELGFRTIRIFALPWGPEGPASYAHPEKRARLYAALDKTLELCDAHGIRVVWSLGAGTFTDTKLEPGQGWVHGEEQSRELMANPQSRGRQLLYRYIDETVKRYRDRKAVVMWEISNEVTLLADQEIWRETPDYFESYDDPDAAKTWLAKTLDAVIEARVPLTYWWCYQADRPDDQTNRQRLDLERDRNPELVACIAEANRRLRAALHPQTSEP